MSKPLDAIVIGAGIAGSTCALQLSRRGHRTLLLDRQAFPRHKTCGEFMSPETKEMLEYLDIRLLDQKVMPSAMDHAQIIMPQGGQIEAPLPGSAYGISRHELDRILHSEAKAAGTEIITKATIIGIQQLEDDHYEVQVKKGNERLNFRAKAVIGAYGTKKPRGITSPPQLRDDTVYVGVKSHYSGLPLSNRVELYFCEGGYVGISPIENGTANVAALLTLNTVQGSGKSVTDILHAASTTNGRLAARLAEGSPVPETQVSIAPLNLSNIPEPWSQFPHIGDAMLMIPPLCGDGMSIALRSSILCAEWTNRYLKKDISFEEWQQGYTKDANNEFTQLLRRARRIQKLAFAKTNKYYPGLARLIPGLATYLVKATRLSEMNLVRR
ncbi:NAD(P)/FAD-dependent oxidoreductase [Paenibacillus xylanilyticus]|uniref:NAD(P)/FAD-dependent oxidoreductase n=1 Tax=Paenibacillus xylanilyticus TaxID=248903 RepID=UPI0039A1D4A8